MYTLVDAIFLLNFHQLFMKLFSFNFKPVHSLFNKFYTTNKNQTCLVILVYIQLTTIKAQNIFGKKCNDLINYSIQTLLTDNSFGDVL